MKVNELSIGDIVQTPHGDISVVSQILKGDSLRKADAIIVLNNKYTYLLNDLQPVPITSKILVLNEFEKEDEDVRNYGLQHYQDGLLAYVALYYIDSTMLEIRTFRSPFQKFESHDIKYVHQLQHALRLCGIEKEIFF